MNIVNSPVTMVTTKKMVLLFVAVFSCRVNGFEFSNKMIKTNDIAPTSKPYFCSINIVNSPVLMAVTKTPRWLQKKYVEP